MIETEQTGDEEFDLSTVVNKGIVRYIEILNTNQCTYSCR